MLIWIILPNPKCIQAHSSTSDERPCILVPKQIRKHVFKHLTTLLTLIKINDYWLT